MGLKITKAGDYAVRAMIHLSCLPEGSTALRSEIADAQDIPGSFMAKILRRLVRAKLLESMRGVHGGFALARATPEISLLEVIEAVEGPVRVNDCSPAGKGCDREASCPARGVWTQVENAIREILASVTLEDLASAPRHNGRVDWAPPIHIATPASAREPAPGVVECA